MNERKKAQLEKQLQFIDEFTSSQESEILSNAEVEAEKERNTIIERERVKIESDFENKMKQTAIKERIHHSQELSQARLQLLKAEDAHLHTLMLQVRNRLMQVRESEEYKPLLKSLIIQGIKILNDRNITIRCVQKDVPLVKTIIQEIAKEHQKLKIDLDELFCLEEKVIGGVTIATMGDSIICNNTLEHRLNQALVVALPLIRKTVFPSLGNRETVQ